MINKSKVTEEVKKPQTSAQLKKKLIKDKINKYNMMTQNTKKTNDNKKRSLISINGRD